MHPDAPGYGFLLFFGAGLGAALGAVVLVGALVARKWTFALTLLGVAAVAAAGYAALLAGVSLASRDVVLDPGVEKHVCEIDCHLAYTVSGVRTAPALGSGAGAVTARGTFWIVTVQARFDETTMGPRRPLDAPVYGGPRTVVVVDEQGRRFAPSHAARPALPGTGDDCLAVGHPLLPGATCTATVVFDLPGDARRPRLLVANAEPVAALVIGHEMSLGHRRSYFELNPQSGTAVRR
jgi:hypothetical protein